MRGFLSIAAASNLSVALATLVFLGWNAAGAHAAARNTARFSSLWFMVAFAAPGLGRLVRGFPARARLVQAFVAAHLVHFAVVAALIASFETAHLVQKPIASAAILVFGFSLVVGAGLTATPRGSRFYSTLHTFTLYVLFLVFFLAFAQNAVKPLRLMAVPLALALILRLTSGWTFYTARAKSPN
ncbi:MAG TPA: hypothetical protein VJN48_18025 [Terriglobales bacterium]|nr:hypothetical protein [Terriglobales bacterium]